VSKCFYFLRHGQTDWNYWHRLQGRQDVCLNDAGRQQCRDIAGVIKDLGKLMVFCSPLQRARQSCQIILPDVLSKVKYIEPLAELSYGEQQRVHDAYSIDLYASVNNKFDVDPEVYVLDNVTQADKGSVNVNCLCNIDRFDDIDSLGDLDRVIEFIVHGVFSNDSNNNILLVSHGSIFEYLCLQLNLPPLSLNNAALVKISISEENNKALTPGPQLMASAYRDCFWKLQILHPGFEIDNTKNE